MSSLACFGTVDDVESALRRERSWVTSCEGTARVTREMQSRKSQLVTACVNVLTQSPGAATYSGWVTRKPERARLIRDTRAFVTRQGNRAITALVDLVVSDLEACRPFHDVVYCGPLEVRSRQSRRVTEARREQLARARAAKQSRSRQCRESVQQRMAERLQIHRSEAVLATA